LQLSRHRQRQCPDGVARRRRLHPALELRCPRPDLLGPSPTRTPTPGQPNRSRPAGLRPSLMMCSRRRSGIVPSSERTKIDARWTQSIYPLPASRLGSYDPSGCANRQAGDCPKITLMVAPTPATTAGCPRPRVR